MKYITYLSFIVLGYLLHLALPMMKQISPSDWTAEDVSAAANAITAIGLIFLIFQSVLLYRQLKADHERSRRRTATDMLANWTKSLDRRISIARRFVENLPQEVINELHSEQTILVSRKNKKLLREVLKEKEMEVEGDSIRIESAGTSKLRWLLITYLNNLETILSAWRHKIADRDMIEEQFGYLFSEDLGHAALKKFRKAAGGARSYPSIEQFAFEMSEKQKHKLVEKSKLP